MVWLIFIFVKNKIKFIYVNNTYVYLREFMLAEPTKAQRRNLD